MLPAAVESGKWFFVQQHSKSMFVSDAFHHVHQEEVVVDGDIELLEHWCAFELIGRNLIVPGLQRDAQL